MKETHIHEVLRMMVEQKKTYENKKRFVKDIEEQFGSDVSFYACSTGGMNAEEAFDFLIRRGKISVNTDQQIGIDSEMTMCDENTHDHAHDGHHHRH